MVIESLWLERLRDLSRLANRGGSALSAMLLVAAILVTFAAIRLAIDARLAELREAAEVNPLGVHGGVIRALGPTPPRG